MTWKLPKINYIPADGVTDDDLNRVEGNTLDNHDRVDKIVDGTIPAAEATNADNADNADKLDGKHYTDIQADLDSKASDTDLTNHTGNTDNPHTVTQNQVGIYAQATEPNNPSTNDIWIKV